MNYEPRIFQLNPASILIEFEADIHENLLYYILDFKTEILKNNAKSILQINTSYCSLLIIYNSSIRDFYSEKKSLMALISELKNAETADRKIKKIPVCYDSDFGWDLDLLSDDLELSVSDIIQKHSEPIYTVYFIGFLPGFPYLGGLNSSLFHRRKSQPRRQIPSGSVGIADQQTGVYPIDSPGGWQIIGRSPKPLFDPSNSERLSFLEAGDKVQFESISKEEFEYIQSNSEAKSW